MVCRYKKTVLINQSKDLEIGNTVLLIGKKFYTCLFAFIYCLFGKVLGEIVVRKYLFFQLFRKIKG